MKLKSAIDKANIIAKKLELCNGLIETQGASHNFYQFTTAYLFGSTAKGKPEPNDVDILYSGKTMELVHPGLLLGRLNSENCALRELRRGMKMIRFHHNQRDGNFSDIPQTKIMIYPVNQLERDCFIINGLKNDIIILGKMTHNGREELLKLTQEQFLSLKCSILDFQYEPGSTRLIKKQPNIENI